MIHMLLLTVKKISIRGWNIEGNGQQRDAYFKLKYYNNYIFVLYKKILVYYHTSIRKYFIKINLIKLELFLSN